MRTSRCRRSGDTDDVTPARGLNQRVGLCLLLLLGASDAAFAQSISHRGFVEGVAHAFPQTMADDRAHLVADVLAREEIFARPVEWLRLASGFELRANSHDQVEDSWRVRFWDRTDRRPRLTVRTLSATMTRGPFTLDAGKQFIRWGKTDVVVPTDRFSPKDYLTVVDAPFLAVTGVRGTAQFAGFTIEAAWVPRFTPSRTPLLTQRWAGQAADVAAAVPIVDTTTALPRGAQTGVRFGQVADRIEYSASFYEGFNHLPDFHVSDPSCHRGLSRSHACIRLFAATAPMPPFRCPGSR